MMNELQEIFTKEYLLQLERMSLRMHSRLSVNGYSGGRRSHAKGSSLEFSDFREYIQGDDLRRVDWNSFGRFGKLYVKLYLEDKQAEINFFLDCSRSMEQDEKFLQAKAITASLVYIALCGGDRVNLFLWNKGIAAEKRGLAQKNAFSQVLQLLDEAEPVGETDFLRSALLSGPLKRGISFVVSDFLWERPPDEGAKILREKKQELYLIQVLSKEEENPKEGEALRLVDQETGETCDLELTAATLMAYQKALGEHRNALAELCRSLGAGYAHFTEDIPLFSVVRDLLQ